MPSQRQLDGQSPKDAPGSRYTFFRVAPAGMYTFLRVPPAGRGTLIRVATKIGQLAQEVSRLNPWWRDPNWAATDPDLRDAAQTGLNHRSGVLDDLRPAGLYILRGPRRAGKTVTVKQSIEDLISESIPATSIVRLAVDGWSAKDLRTVAQNTALPPVPAGHHRTWMFDEVSAITGDWPQQIKWLRDNDPEFRDATVVLTGSNATALTDAAGTLAGRRGTAPRLDRALLPIGFRTFAHLVREDALPDVGPLNLSELRSPAARDAYHGCVAWLDELVETWETYILYGGFPTAVAAAASGQPLPDSFVDDLFNVIAGDAFKSSRLSVTTEMALLERLWSAMASPANLTSIGTDVGVTHDVVARHVGYLRDSYLLWNCPQKSNKHWLALARAQDKIYAIDPLIARLSHLRNPARADIDPTVLTEMQIGMAVRRNVAAANPTALNDDFLFHMRTPARKEIDFVAHGLAGTAIESKYSEGGSWHAESATINASEWAGLLCTRNVLDTNASDAWAVPAGILAYLIDT